MGRRTPNPNLARRYTLYSIAELCLALDVHYNTVRKWVRRGLKPIDDSWKMYFRGEDVRAFLIAKRQSTKHPCPPGTLYCIPCRSPRAPAHGLVEYRPLSARKGMLVGMCPACTRLMHRTTAAVNATAMIELFSMTRTEE
jgi:hypothetical protein